MVFSSMVNNAKKQETKQTLKKHGIIFYQSKREVESFSILLIPNFQNEVRTQHRQGRFLKDKK